MRASCCGLLTPATQIALSRRAGIFPVPAENAWHIPTRRSSTLSRCAQSWLRLSPVRHSYHKLDRVPFCSVSLAQWHFSTGITRSAQVRVNQLQQFVVHRLCFLLFAAAQRFGGAVLQ